MHGLRLACAGTPDDVWMIAAGSSLRRWHHKRDSDWNETPDSRGAWAAAGESEICEACVCDSVRRGPVDAAPQPAGRQQTGRIFSKDDAKGLRRC